jgi:hypothetical protein
MLRSLRQLPSVDLIRGFVAVVGEIYRLQHSPGQRWYYFSGRGRNQQAAVA